MKRIVILSREYFKKEIKENIKEINNVYDWAVKSISETISIISYGDSPFTSDILSAELFFQVFILIYYFFIFFFNLKFFIYFLIFLFIYILIFYFFIYFII